MDSVPNPQPRVLWSFWLACGLAATGALSPLVLMPGDIGRDLGVAIPFGLAAAAMAVNALTYQRGRSLATALFVLAWVAVVYGILRMIAVPLQEAVAGGSCPASSTDCASGFARPFAGTESVVIGVGIVTGALALQVGYFGLRALYRSTRQQPVVGYAAPPQRIIASRATASSPHPAVEDPVAAAPATVAEPAAVTEPDVVAEPAVAEPVASATPPPEPGPASPPPRKPRTRRPRKPAAEPVSPPEAAELPAHSEAAELPAPAEQAELAAHEEPAELPAHPSDASSA